MSEVSPKASQFTIDTLLRLHDKIFVIKAYEMILGRAPDPGGLENYLAQIRAGADKAHIAAEIALSPEGRLKSLDLPGLPKAIAEYRKRAPSIWGRLTRRLARASIEETQRQLRAIDNKLYLVEQDLLLQSTQLADLLKLVRGMTATPGNAGPNPHLSKGGSENNAPHLSHLTPKLGRTFVELKAAIAAKQLD